jgi:hypothetical protein
MLPEPLTQIGKDHYLIDNGTALILSNLQRVVNGEMAYAALYSGNRQRPLRCGFCHGTVAPRPFRAKREPSHRLVLSHEKTRASKLGRGTRGSKMSAVWATRHYLIGNDMSLQIIWFEGRSQ